MADRGLRAGWVKIRVSARIDEREHGCFEAIVTKLPYWSICFVTTGRINELIE
jgi:hypothetical protein